MAPVDWSEYPDDWQVTAQRIKDEAGWCCQKCGKQCRRPGEALDTHTRTLTVAHINHQPMDDRDENLVALCAPCHLKYDNVMRNMRRLATRRVREAAGQTLFREGG